MYVACIIQVAHTPGALDALVGVLQRDVQDRLATVEAARALANLTEEEKEDGNDLSVAQVALQAEGVPSVAAFVMGTAALPAALVRACGSGADEGKEHAMRCMANLAAAGDAVAGEVAAWPGAVAAMVGLCKGGTELARMHASQAMLNVAVRELELLEGFIDGVYALRHLVDEALNPPPVVIASFVMNGVFSFSSKQTHWIEGVLARTLDVAEESITVTKVALFGTNIGSIVHLTIQLPHGGEDRGAALGHLLVEQSLNGDIARELQAAGIEVARTTLAEDPYVTKKNVFKGRAVAPPLDLGNKAPLSSSPLASSSSPHRPGARGERAGRGEDEAAGAAGAGREEEAHGNDAQYKAQSDAALHTMARQTTFMQVLARSPSLSLEHTHTHVHTRKRARARAHTHTHTHTRVCRCWATGTWRWRWTRPAATSMWPGPRCARRARSRARRSGGPRSAALRQR